MEIVCRSESPGDSFRGDGDEALPEVQPVKLDTRESRRVYWLGDSACHDALQVGGKAANLSRLAAEYPVPAGFCLGAASYPAGDGPELRLSTPLRDQVALAYERLAGRTGHPCPAVAVRSSALDEDGEAASFAGQHLTELNLTGIDAVGAAIERCWASGLTEQALSYRQHHDLSSDGIRLAVLVQHLVVADVSAIVFSANPISGERSQAIITASWGLGESLVGGTVTPDSYVTRKADGKPIEQSIGRKERMTVLGPDGTREVGVPGPMRQVGVLDARQLRELTELAASLEGKMGWPVDIECAYKDGKLALLQCRPITTLQSIESRGR